MTEATTTIRVARQTRDLLAARARDRGLSLAALLREVATQWHIEGMVNAEIDASRADAANGDVADEDDAWDETVGDGLE